MALPRTYSESGRPSGERITRYPGRPVWEETTVRDLAEVRSCTTVVRVPGDRHARRRTGTSARGDFTLMRERTNA